jgi:glycosyltransferase involved in cell wall biosynthesis
MRLHGTTADPSQDKPGPGDIEVSIIVPALNEAANLTELLQRIDLAMAGRWGRRYEVLIIDDNSTDGTPAVCAELAREYPLSLHVRSKPHSGLSGAVLHGLALACGKILVVMDADLQHPPERLPDLVAPLAAGDGSAPGFVLGSRYVAGGSMAEKWGVLRRFNSRVATLLARPFAGNTRDPMSGFFAMRRETYATGRYLTPLGYKVGLELMCKCRVGSVHEVPIHFNVRSHGQSKLTLKEQFRYLEHLSRLYDFHYPHGSPIAKFLIATGVSWLVGLALYLVLLSSFRPAERVIVPVLAYPAAILTTAAFHAHYVRVQREFLVSRRPWLSFWVIAAAEWVCCAATAAWVAWRMRDATVTEAFLLTFGFATLVRYILRKELLMDIRGLRRDPRRDEAAGDLAANVSPEARLA